MRVGVFIGEQFEEIETLTTVDLLRRAGYDVETVSVSHSHHVFGSHHIEIKTDFVEADVHISMYDMLVLPGGPGHKNLEKCKRLVKHVELFPGDKKYVAAICAAPSILGRAGVLEGLRATCFPGYESELKGAIYTGNEVEADGYIITGRSAGCAVPFALKIVETISGKEEAEKLAKSICYDYYK